MGSPYLVKTTIDIADALLARAKRRARADGKSLRALVEEGLRRVLQSDRQPVGYELADCSVGDPAGPDPLQTLSWQELRDEIYGGR
jgi:hypothetical protein